MFSHLRLVLFLFLCSNRLFVVNSAEDECFPVQRCSDGLTLGIGKLAYNVDGNVTICPRSDPDVPSWEFLFTVNLNTSFCSADQFDRSVVCYETNSLKFSNLTGFHNQIGSIIFLDTTFGLNVTVLYGPVGVHPVNNLVFFKYNQTHVEMRWLVYYINNRPTIEVFFEDQMIARDGDAINCTQCTPSVDVTTCARSQAQETTTQYSIFLFNPTASFEGKYVLVADSSSATITLVIDPSSIPEPPKDISSSSSEVPEPTSTMDMSTPTPSENSVDNSTVIIIIAVLVVLVIVISVSLGVAGIVWKVKKSRRTDQGSNLPIQNPIYPETVDTSRPTDMTNDLSSSNQNPPQTEPSNNQTVLTNGNHLTLGQAESPNVTDSVSADPHHTSQVSNQVEAVDSGQPVDETNTNNLPPTLTDQSLTQARTPENPNVVSNDNVAQAVGRVADVLVDIREKLSKQHNVENDQRGKMIDAINRIHNVESDQLEVQENIAGQLETALVNDQNTNTQDEPANVATISSPENTELSITDTVETDEQVHVTENTNLNEPAQLQLCDVENVRSDQPCDSGSISDELDSGILERSPFAEESSPKPDTSNTQGGSPMFGEEPVVEGC